MVERVIENLLDLLNVELEFMSKDVTDLIGNFTYCCPGIECDRCKYVKKYSGDQDQTMRKMDFLNFKDEEIEFLASPKFPRNGDRLKVMYPLIVPKNTIVKNFRLTNLKNVLSVEIEIGGQRFDKVYKDIIPVLQMLYDLDIDVIPFYFSKVGINSLAYHEIRINVKYEVLSDDDRLEFDIYKWNKDDKKIDSIFYQLQYTGYEDMSRDVRLFFNHPISYIFVRGYNPDELDVRLNEDIFCIKRWKRIGEISIYPISDGMEDTKNVINFSRIDNPVLRISNKSSNLIYVYVLSLNGIRCMSGMAGTLWGDS